MADSLPSPPVSPSRARTSSTASLEVEHENETQNVLITRLDDLLAQYLELLDQYTILRTQLSKSLSAGFFSLAQAQRASTLGPARRYGEECYDERMKAQRTLTIEKDTSSPRSLVYKVEKKITTAKEDAKAKTIADDTKSSHVAISESKPDSRKVADNESSREITVESNGQSSGVSKPRNREEKPKADPSTRDPITWFGVLVPPALRQTQGHFIEAIDTCIPDLINVQTDMESLEEQIWSLRRDLGMLDLYQEEDDKESESTIARADDSVRENSVAEPKPSKTSVRKRLPARPSHSKSTLLQLGD